MTLTTDARDRKAQQIAETFKAWQAFVLPSGQVAYRIPSQTGNGVHTVTLRTCSCEDARQHQAERRCKHVLALTLVLDRLARSTPCTDWTCARAHETRRTGPAFASYHPVPAFRCECGFDTELLESMEAHTIEAHPAAKFAALSADELFGRL